MQSKLWKRLNTFHTERISEHLDMVVVENIAMKKVSFWIFQIFTYHVSIVILQGSVLGGCTLLVVVVILSHPLCLFPSCVYCVTVCGM